MPDSRVLDQIIKSKARFFLSLAFVFSLHVVNIVPELEHLIFLSLEHILQLVSVEKGKHQIS